MKAISSMATIVTTSVFMASQALALEVITFDENVLDGVTSFSFDGNGDNVADVVFSTQDPFGFNTFGPGPNMSYIQEPGLEGTTGIVGEDLRVDFLGGATGNIEFSFAVSEGAFGEEIFDPLELTASPRGGVTFSVFDANDNLLNSTFQNSYFTETDFSGGGLSDLPEIIPGGSQGISSFPEAILALNFPGVASYGVFDFEEGPGRYILDNFTGTFDSAAENVAPPGSLPETALLPDNTGDPFFNFSVVIGENGLGTEFPLFIDPDVAVAYEYQIGPGGPEVVSVLIPAALPNGDSEFFLNICGEATTYNVTAGSAFDLSAVAGSGGVDCFVISGIDTAEMLDPTNPLAFITGLTFSGAGQVNITQTPITTFVNPNVSSVPEPSTIGLMLSSLFGLGYIRRRRRKI